MKGLVLMRILLASLAALGLAIGLTGCPGEDPVEEDPCEDVVCDTPPANDCDGDVVVRYPETGTCRDGECDYPPTRTPCPAGHACVDAECVPEEPGETCDDIEPCVDKPADHCDDNTLVIYAETGTCVETDDGPECVYHEYREDCGDDHVCEVHDEEPRCVPISTGETCDDIEPCDSPPADHCDGNTLVTYEEQGTCVEDEDGAECVYESTEHDCGDDHTCEVENGVPACVPISPPQTCDDIEPCDNPPGPECMDNVAIVYEDEGTCIEDENGAECVYDPVETDCSDDERVCVVEAGEASCVDLCEEVSCPARTDGCDGDVMVTYGGDEGECDWQTGDCVYPTDDETRTQCGATELCDLDEHGDPQCLEPICGLAPPPASPGDDGGYCEHPLCDGEPACEFGYNFDFETWVDDEPPGFYWWDGTNVAVSPDDSTVNTGQYSARLESSNTSNQDLRAAVLFRDVIQDAVYTFHAWYQYDGRVGDDGFLRFGIWALEDDGSLGTGWNALTPTITDETRQWTEVALASPVMDDDRNIMLFARLQASTDAGTSVAWLDDWALTLPYEFTLDHESRDGADIDVAVAGDSYIGAAVNNAGALYVATNGASHPHDRFVFVWVGDVGTDMVAVPWDKDQDATVAGPADGGELLVLVQEESNAYCEWLRWDASAEGWELVSSGVDDGTCTNQAGSVLAGVVDLADLIGVDPDEVPAVISFAAAGYETADGGGLVHETQVPESTNDDGVIDPDETAAIHRASLLAGKVH